MSSVFPGKSKPTFDKLRGGYYTPEPLARFVAEWVGSAGQLLLEPACGDGAILAELDRLGCAVGLELIPEEATKAAERTGARVVTDDFFRWRSANADLVFDGVAGNPPFIRFGNWETSSRDRALEYMRSKGLSPSRLTNAWLPFVVASIDCVKEGGRVGLVLPAELLQVNYARELRAFLIDNCSEIHLVSFSKLLFPGVLQEVVVLLAVKGVGPAAVNAVEVPDLVSLECIDLSGNLSQAAVHESEKWTKYYLDVPDIDLLRRVLASGSFRDFGDFAAVNVGVVTGRNSFFCLSSSRARDLGIFDDTMGLLSRSAQLRSVEFSRDDLLDAQRRGFKDRLLAVAPDRRVRPNEPLNEYIRLGEQEEVHRGYKCSIRSPWWSVPSIQVPDGFMLRQVSSSLLVAANTSGATSTDTVHRVFLNSDVSMHQLAVASLNSVTRVFSEIMGRSYGGGLLEIEPKEALRLPVPDPYSVSDELFSEVDLLLRNGEEQAAVELVDDALILRPGLLSLSDLSAVRNSHKRLRDRRLGRGRK